MISITNSSHVFQWMLLYSRPIAMHMTQPQP